MSELEKGYYWVKQYNHFPWDIMEYDGKYFWQIGIEDGLKFKEIAEVGERIYETTK